jgi:hypothetical protein
MEHKTSINHEKGNDANRLLAVVLKTKYKSCANCYLYQLYPQDFCLAGYPLERLEQDHVVGHRFGVDTFHIPYKPKYGCLGKEQFGKPTRTLHEHIEVAKMLSEHYG